MTDLKQRVSPLWALAALVLTFMLVAALPMASANALVAGDSGLSKGQKDSKADTDDADEETPSFRCVENGTYVVNIADNTKLVMDVLGSSKKAGSRIVMNDDAATNTQKWTFIWNEKKKAYRIKNDKTNLFVTAKADEPGKAQVIQSKSTSKDLQYWVIEEDEAGYRIYSKADRSLALGTWGSKSSKNANITLVDKDSSIVTFYLLPTDFDFATSKTSTLDGMFANICLAENPKVNIGIKNDSDNDGASAILEKDGKSKSQTWYFEAVNAKKGLYRIINTESSKALSVDDKGFHIDTDVVQDSASESSSTTQWWVRKSKSGCYTFISRYNGLSVSSESTEAGANVALGFQDKNYEFLVREVTMLSPGCYSISPLNKSSVSWSIPGANKNANVQLRLNTTNNSQLAQKFFVSQEKNHTYAIRSAITGRCIGEVKGKVVQGSRGASGAQLWKAAWKHGSLVFKNAKTGHYLMMSGPAKKGTKLVAKYNFKASKGCFAFNKTRLIEDGLYYVTKGNNSSKLFGIAEKFRGTEGAPVGIFKKARSLSLMFRVLYSGTDASGNDTYIIRNEFNCKCLTANGNNVSQRNVKYKNPQKWIAEVSKSGKIAFKNEATGRYLSFGKSKMTTVSANKASASNASFNLKQAIPLNALHWDAYNRLLVNPSNTNYAVLVNLSAHRVYIWHRTNKKSPWALKYDWICSSGKMRYEYHAKPTPEFNRLSSGKKRLVNYPTWPDGVPHNSSFYYLTWVGPGTYIHTPLYKLGSWTQIKDGRMGQFISGGCIRVHTENAKWIYTHIKRGTRMITYY